MENSPAYTQTYTGIMFDLANPDPGMVCIEDIAHQTSIIGRFTGATKRLISVAEHGVLVMRLMERDFGQSELSFAGLMHDAHEAYMGDISSPMKTLIGPRIKEIERPIQNAVMSAFEVVWDDSIEALVKRYDLMARRSETHSQMRGQGHDWEWGDIPLVLDHDIVPYLPQAAETEFIRNFRRYRNG